MKIALFSPLHPMKSGIADYTEEMLPLLRKHFEIDLYVDSKFVPTSPSLRSEFGVFHFQPGSFSASEYDAVVYHMGNYYPAHRFVYEALRTNPGIVVLHDCVLQGFYARRAEVERSFEEYRRLLETYYGKKGTEIADSVSRRVQPPIWETEEALDFPLNEEVLGLATGVIVHSDFVKERVERKTARPVAKIPHHGHILKTFDRGAERKKWGVDPDDILISSIGFVNRNRRYELVIAALGELASPRLKYYIAGEDRGKLLRDLITASSVRVSVESFLPLEKLESLIFASDICVNLRYPTMGESSGALLRQMGYARPTLVTNCGSYAEIPDWAALKIEPDIDESALLKAYLAALIEDPDFRLSVGREAAAYVQSECDIEKCVSRYADFITANANKNRPGDRA
ncbi:MAG: glycosyltransferase family 4 protein [Clostridiales bacterium]|nr:glycosyltransferase family 4 protein [Clostridiales bacterium]